jgi:hypothetical protein
MSMQKTELCAAIAMLDVEWMITQSCLNSLSQELAHARNLGPAGSDLLIKVRSKLVLVHEQRISINVRRRFLSENERD